MQGVCPCIVAVLGPGGIDGQVAAVLLQGLVQLYHLLCCTPLSKIVVWMTCHTVCIVQRATCLQGNKSPAVAAWYPAFLETAVDNGAKE